MNNKKSTKRALTSSILSLVLCIAMLIGSTFAWFTDNVTSANNIIKSGTLDVEMYYADGTKEVPIEKSEEWADASEGAIFNYEKWEPGYVEVHHIKIANVGTLALKYQLKIMANGEVSKLADVIDVYYADPATKVSSRTELTDGMRLGTLTEVLSGLNTTPAAGELIAKTSDTITLALKMQESAGNEYQDLSIGTDFSVVLMATQLTNEKDSFDEQYDKFADYDGEISNAVSLAAALQNGGTFKVTSDIALDSTMTVPAGVTVNLDLGTNSIAADNAKGNGALIANKGTLAIVGGKLLNNAVNGDSVISNSGTLTLDGVNIVGAPIDSTGYPAYAVTTSGKLVVEEGTIISASRGAVSTSNGAEVVINGGNFVVSDAADGRNMTLHTIYAYGSGAKLTINDGYFEMNHTSTGGASVICPAGATISIYGGIFRDAMDDTNWTSTGNFQNYMGYGAPVDVYGGNFDDNTVNKNLADGYVASPNADGTYTVVAGTSVKTVDELQNAVNNAENGDVIVLGSNITGDVKVTQKDNVAITINGNGNKFNGVMTVFGNGRKATAALNIKNIDFVAANGADSCIVSPDRSKNNAYSYSSNVTVDNCTFTDPDGTVNCAAVRHEDGGDSNWKIVDCVVDNTMHSMIQTNNVELAGLAIQGCTINSKNGINLNQCAKVSIVGCTIDVKGYAVRFGVKGATVNGNFEIKDSILKSANDDGDAVIIFRGTMTGSTLTISNTTIDGSPDISGNANVVRL